MTTKANSRRFKTASSLRVMEKLGTDSVAEGLHLAEKASIEPAQVPGAVDS